MKGKSLVLTLALVCTTALALMWPGEAFSQRGSKSLIARGKYLVDFGGCNDCHSPKVFGPMGPVPDTTKLLSGAPSGNTVPEIPQGALAPGKWGAVTTPDLTTWAGPWGVSFARNLTPDKTTGLGSWTDAVFIKAMRTGKDMGEGRAILPPMPWFALAGLTDADLRAIFAYLHTLKPIHNAVHDPIPPSGGQGAAGTGK